MPGPRWRARTARPSAQAAWRASADRRRASRPATTARNGWASPGWRAAAARRAWRTPCFRQIEAFRLVAEHRIAQVERAGLARRTRSTAERASATCAGRRQIAGDHRRGVGQPAVGLQRVDHGGDLRRAVPVAGKTRIAWMVRQHDRRQRDDLVPEPMQRRNHRRRARPSRRQRVRKGRGRGPSPDCAEAPRRSPSEDAARSLWRGCAWCSAATRAIVRRTRGSRG